MKILIKNIDIITSDVDNMFIKSNNIAIDGNIITHISSEELQDFIPDKIIDGKNKIAMPGFINTHTHSPMTILRNFAGDKNLEEWLFKNIFPAESKLTSQDVHFGATLGMAEMIKSGTTHFADMYFHMDEVANVASDVGMRVNLSSSPIALITNELKIEEASLFYKRWHNTSNGRLKVFIEVHSIYLFTKELLKVAADIAKDLNTGIHTHILETEYEKFETLKNYNKTSVELCEETGIFDVPVIAAHCVHLTDNDIEILKNKNVSVIHNPTSNLKLGSGIARIPTMIEKGINVCLGTDGAASNNNLNMLKEMNIAALIHKGVSQNPTLITAQQSILMGTANGAKALGYDNLGMIKEGFLADIILINTDGVNFTPINDPIAAVVYSASSADVDTVIVDGNILMENRELTTIDEEKVKFEVKKISSRITN